GGFAQLALTDSTISGNSAGSGGGISSDTGAIALLRSTISGNTAGSGGGVLVGYAPLTLTDAHVTGNTATSGNGGGILGGFDAAVLANNTQITGNAAPNGNGGGIWGFGFDFHGSVILNGSTVANNSAILGGGISTEGPLTVTASTIAQNSAVSGGGVHLFGGFAQLALTDSTISGNSAGSGGGISSTNNTSVTVSNSTIAANTAVSNGGGILSTGALRAVSTIVAGNKVGSSPNDVAGSFAAGSTNNLVQDAAHSGGLTNGVNGNIIGVDPRLAPLAFNGGPTQTHALLRNSPAINKGINPLGLHTDQRGPGYARTFGGQTDIGAYEFALGTAGNPSRVTALPVGHVPPPPSVENLSTPVDPRLAPASDLGPVFWQYSSARTADSANRSQSPRVEATPMLHEANWRVEASTAIGDFKRSGREDAMSNTWLFTQDAGTNGVSMAHEPGGTTARGWRGAW
ncbi:MAG: hypothetical protein JNM07_08310, partial [Phycisphaerae bacterium]|nr:hypothetical protein [Phycisphaerae bacterium]